MLENTGVPLLEEMILVRFVPGSLELGGQRELSSGWLGQPGQGAGREVRAAVCMWLGQYLYSASQDRLLSQPCEIHKFSST